MALKMHPDKAMQFEGMSYDEADARFKLLQEAYNVLSDPRKKLEYDSTIEVDDFLPSSADTPEEFYRVFGAAFRRLSRWSVDTNLPNFGNEDTPFQKVKKFYEFYYKFKSRRVFPHEDEEDEELAESREHRRWIKQNNEKLRRRAKKDERDRIAKFVEAAYKCDPRIAAKAQAEKEERERKKQDRADERRRQKEEEEARKAEEEARKAEEERRQAEQEAERKRIEKARKQELRTLRSSLKAKLSERQVPSADIDVLCQELELDQLRDLLTTIEGGNDSDISHKVQNDLDQAKDRIKERELVKEREKAELIRKFENMSKVDEEKKMAKMEEWTAEELRLLNKAVDEKFPAGSQRRWENIAAYVRTRTVDEVIFMVKHRLAKGYVPKATQEAHSHYQIAEKRKKNLNITSDADQRETAFSDLQQKGTCALARCTTVSFTTWRAHSNPPPNPPPHTHIFLADLKGNAALATPKTEAKVVSEASGAWTQVQEMALVKAMKTFGKELADRWDRVAEAVPGKSKVDCMKRFKELAVAAKAKKDGAAS